MKYLFSLLFVALLFAAPTRANSVAPFVPTTSAEAVFFAYSYNEAMAEIGSKPDLPLRFIAGINRELAFSFANTPMWLYFVGRWHAFEQAADLAGEP